VCSKLEGAGLPNKIQCSKETADHLIKSGKGAWLHKRHDVISLSGKGVIEAYWVAVRGERAGSMGSNFSSQLDTTTTTEKPQAWSEPLLPGISERSQRQIEWNVDVLLKLLKEITARRASIGYRRASLGRNTTVNGSSFISLPSGSDSSEHMESKIPLEEVKEIIELPDFDMEACRNEHNPKDMIIPPAVIYQLHKYVTFIASLYKPNPFHK